MKQFSLAHAAPGTGPFRAILWKELREGMKWGALALLVVAAALFTWVRTAGQQIVLPDPPLSTLTTTLVAIAIGLAQTVPEHRGDAWGFLIHRPVARSTLFAGKVVAGMLLYGVATLVPLAGTVVWMAIAGHRAMPFDPRLALPGVADFLFGLVYYLAAFVIGMRDARWFGSRALAIGVGVACTICGFSVADFWQAAAIAGVGTVVVGAAAWGTFVAGGRYEPQPRTSRAAVWVSVGCGLALAGSIATGILMNVLPSASESARSYAYEVTDAGAVVQTVRENGAVVEMDDLAGHPLAEAGSHLDHAGVLPSAAIGLNPDADRGVAYRDADNVFVRLGVTTGPRPSVWYFVRRRGLIAGYDIGTRQIIGWLGPAGFTAGPVPPSQRFNGQLAPYRPNRFPLLIAFPGAVYRVTLAQETLERVFSPQAGDTVIGAADPEGSFTSTAETRTLHGVVISHDSESVLTVATARQVYVLDPRGSPLLTVPRDPRAAGYGTLVVSRALLAPGRPIFIWYQADKGTLPEDQWEKLPQVVTKFEGDSVAAQFSLSPRHSAANSPWAQGVVVPGVMVPLVATIALDLYDHATDQLDLDAGLSPTQNVALWILTILVSLLSAGVTFSLGRRFAFNPTRLSLWTLLGFAFGLFGLLLMLSLMEWPARETCPACGRKRVVTRERCEHCGGTFAQPVPDGTEIFELVTAR